MVAEGNLGQLEVYRLQHQHPLNQASHWFGIPLVAASAFYPLGAWLAWDVIAWRECLALGGVGWALQFLGHWIEGNKPAFFKDPRQLVAGPLFFLGKPLFWLWPHLTGRPFFKTDAPPAEQPESADAAVPPG